jgi:hypothetical protein
MRPAHSLLDFCESARGLCRARVQHYRLSMIAKTGVLIGAIVLSCTGCNDAGAETARDRLVASLDRETTAQAKGVAPETLLEQRAKKLAEGLVADGAPLRGALQEGGRRDQLLVLRGGFCYRILGAGDDGVEDLDLFLYDPNGVQTHQDPGQDRFPVLGLQAEICPPTSGAYRLQALMYKGSGAYALRTFRTP